MTAKTRLEQAGEKRRLYKTLAALGSVLSLALGIVVKVATRGRV